MPGFTHRSLVGDMIRRDRILDVRIDDHLRVSQGKWGSARHATPSILGRWSVRSITQSG
jgi:hypothetical protein